MCLADIKWNRCAIGTNRKQKYVYEPRPTPRVEVSGVEVDCGEAFKFHMFELPSCYFLFNSVLAWSTIAFSRSTSETFRYAVAGPIMPLRIKALVFLPV